MDKTQAAKLAQAYQWLAEGKEVECLLAEGLPWKQWSGVEIGALQFRLKPRPLLEGWANEYPDRIGGIYPNPESARMNAHPTARRQAVHMREVREPDIKAMVEHNATHRGIDIIDIPPELEQP